MKRGLKDKRALCYLLDLTLVTAIDPMEPIQLK